MDVPLTDVRVNSDFMPSDSGNESDDFANAALPDLPPRRDSDPFARCVPRPRLTPVLWRSVEMSRARLFVEKDMAFNLVSRLGEMGCVQFIDLNAGMLFGDRAFGHDILLCDEVDRKLRALRSLLRQRNVRIPRVVLQLAEEGNLDLDTMATQATEELQVFFFFFFFSLIFIFCVKHAATGLAALEHSHAELSELMMLLRFVENLLQAAEAPRSNQV